MRSHAAPLGANADVTMSGGFPVRLLLGLALLHVLNRLTYMPSARGVISIKLFMPRVTFYAVRRIVNA